MSPQRNRILASTSVCACVCVCADPFVVRGKQSSRSNDRVDCNFRFISFRFVLISADASLSQLLVALSRREARYKLQYAVCVVCCVWLPLPPSALANCATSKNPALHLSFSLFPAMSCQFLKRNRQGTVTHILHSSEETVRPFDGTKVPIIMSVRPSVRASVVLLH